MRDLKVNVLCNNLEEQNQLEKELQEKYYIAVINYMPWNRWDLPAYRY